MRMMRGVAASLEQHHKVQVLDEAIGAAVGLSRRYIPARQLPDKSVSVLDTACARVAVSQSGDAGRAGGLPAADRGARDRAGRCIERESAARHRRRAPSDEPQAEARLAASSARGRGARDPLGRRRRSSGRPDPRRCATSSPSRRDDGAGRRRGSRRAARAAGRARRAPGRGAADAAGGRQAGGGHGDRELDRHPGRPDGEGRDRGGARAWPTRSRRRDHRPGPCAGDDRPAHPDLPRRAREPEQADRRVPAVRARPASARPRPRWRWPRRSTAASRTSSPSTCRSSRRRTPSRR